MRQRDIFRLAADLPLLTREQLTERADTQTDAHDHDCRCVNYVRHEMTHYDYALTCGKRHGPLKSGVLRAIALAYPWLRDECEQQSYGY